MRALLLALLVLGPAAPAKEAPVKRLDWTKAVGAPVLDEKTNEGVYVWIEDGWFNVAAVARPEGKAKAKRPVSVNIRSTKKLGKHEGDFAVRPAGNGVVLSALVGEVVVKGRFQTDGEITVTTRQPLYVGPLSKRTLGTVTIGRY